MIIRIILTICTIFATGAMPALYALPAQAKEELLSDAELGKRFEEARRKFAEEQKKAAEMVPVAPELPVVEQYAPPSNPYAPSLVNHNGEDISAAEAEALSANQFKIEPIQAEASAAATPQAVTTAPTAGALASPPAVASPENILMTKHGDADVVIRSSGTYLPSNFVQDVELGDIRIAVNLENVTLRRAVDQIIKGAENKAGPWEVKWRLQPTNAYLLDEKMNLTAETNFSSFLNHVLERVNNMTGVRLFVAVFGASRIIVISDTYY